MCIFGAPPNRSDDLWAICVDGMNAFYHTNSLNGLLLAFQKLGHEMDEPSTSQRFLSFDDNLAKPSTSRGLSDESRRLSRLSTQTTTTSEDTDDLGQPVTNTSLLQKKKSVLELFPWLDDIEKAIQSCLGSVTHLKNKTVLSAMDYFIW